ncbi:MAG: phosphatidylglycerophosphatase A [Candidatus Zixiibacteriota bacterium]
MSVNKFLIKFFSTLFFSGYSPIAPGTCGSLVTILLAWFLIPEGNLFLLIITLIWLFIALFIGREAEKLFGHDAGKINIDESAGMLLSLLWVPKKFILYGVAFLLFRLYDIIKPPPLRGLEKIEGYGVTLDDVLAGLYANLTLQILLALKVFS